MPFGLTNAPATFQTLMNQIFHEYLDDFVLIYLDDILIFSKSETEHYEHLRKVFTVLRREKLYCAPNKCEFFKPSMEFLGHIVAADGIHVDPKKTKTIMEWPPPSNTKSTDRNAPEKDAFVTLKNALTSAPVLSPANPDLPYKITTDASDFAIGAVLSQQTSGGDRPVAFESRKLSDAEKNYPTHDKEMLAIVYALRTWRHYVEGTVTNVYTDHNSLIYFMKQPTLSRRQARWMEFLQEFGNDLTINYLKGNANVVADALSRRPDYSLNAITTAISTDPEWLSDLKAGYSQDSETQQILDGDVLPAKVRTEDGLIYFDNRLWIPAVPALQTRIISLHHDPSLAGHLGMDKTYLSISENYYWPKLRDSVRNYVKSCVQCQRNKPLNQKPAGLLHPLPIPSNLWEHVTLDLIVQLPKTPRGKDAIVTFVDKLSKMVHFVATTTDITAPALAQLFIDNVVRLHGLPRVLISDRDSRFTSHFWQSLFAALDVELHLSTAYHPQSDGQSERANRTIEEMLRSYINEKHDNWDLLLSPLEIAYNSATQASVKFSPYFLNYGCHPDLPGTLLKPRTSTNVQSADFLTTVSTALAAAKQHLREATERQKRFADKHRSIAAYQVGDEVWLSTADLKLPGSARKFQSRWIGPFKVAKVVNPVAYELELSDDLPIHDVFHVSKLKRFIPTAPEHSTRPTKQIPLGYAPGGTPIFEVESICDRAWMIFGEDSRAEYGYLVKWRDCAEHENSWEPMHNLVHCREIVDEFNQSHPVAAGEPPIPAWPTARRPRQRRPLPPDDNIFIVESILDRRSRRIGRGYCIEYLIKWAGYPDSENTWENRKHLLTAGADVQRMMREADEQFPT